MPTHLDETLELRARAATLALPKSAAFSHETAAELHGLPIPRPAPRLHVSVPASEVVSGINGIKGHEGLVEAYVAYLGEIRLVAEARTFLDLAPALSLTDLVILGDAVARRLGKDALRVVVEAGERRRGVVKAREALDLTEEDVDSPMKTRSRLLIVSGGLPRPRVNKNVIVDGHWLACPDLSYPQFKLAIEYDGDTHRTDRKQWRDDIFRKEVLEDYGWRCIVLTSDDIFTRPTLTVHRIRGALLDRGWRP